MVKARTLWPGVESPPAPTGQGAEHPVYPCQSNCISSPDCHLLNDPSNKSEALPGDGTGLDANFNATVLEGVSILQAVYFLEELDEPTNRLVGHISSTDGINLQGSVEVPLRPSAEYDKGFFVLAMPCQ